MRSDVFFLFDTANLRVRSTEISHIYGRVLIQRSCVSLSGLIVSDIRNYTTCVDIDACKFQNINCKGAFGSVYVSSPTSAVSMKDSVLRNCFGGKESSGFVCLSSKTTVVNCCFDACRAPHEWTIYYGGSGLFVSLGEATVKNIAVSFGSVDATDTCQSAVMFKECTVNANLCNFSNAVGDGRSFRTNGVWINSCISPVASFMMFKNNTGGHLVRLDFSQEPILNYQISDSNFNDLGLYYIAILEASMTNSYFHDDCPALFSFDGQDNAIKLVDCHFSHEKSYYNLSLVISSVNEIRSVYSSTNRLYFGVDPYPDGNCYFISPLRTIIFSNSLKSGINPLIFATFLLCII